MFATGKVHGVNCTLRNYGKCFVIGWIQNQNIQDGGESDGARELIVSHLVFSEHTARTSEREQVKVTGTKGTFDWGGTRDILFIIFRI